MDIVNLKEKREEKQLKAFIEARKAEIKQYFEDKKRNNGQ